MKAPGWATTRPEFRAEAVTESLRADSSEILTILKISPDRLGKLLRFECLGGQWLSRLRNLA
jgi:hypothetical protein